MPLRSSVQQSGPFGEFQAFVAGATGGTGQAIVRRLVAEGVPVRALVRDISRAVSHRRPALPGSLSALHFWLVDESSRTLLLSCHVLDSSAALSAYVSGCVSH